ncbi:hypothetical protein AVEN_16920-1 [Araneus ventricosus]|uniref:RNase H type-1 domain-containing protein n=1 Tax=Araneus ventricosus TaxID=182803 RepID=A0A4Y2J9I8_ARAVE|nr:hypothetical protein AVEN_16920-1 [Araneus ventricosus]
MLLHDSDLNNVSVQLSDFFTFPPWEIPQFSFLNPFSGFDKSSTAPVTFQQLFHHHRYQYSSFVPIFTDGSKSDGHFSCGVVSPSDTLSYRLHNCCSVFTAELVVIFCALQEISPSSQRNFILYTDSMSALETLSHYDTQMHPVGLEILSILQFLRKEDFSIIFCWVPSHVGISGNETADAIAKFASAVLPRALPYVDVKKFFVSHLFSLWQQKSDLLTNNKLHSVKPSIGLWPTLPIRQVDVKLSRLRIGHTRFTHKYLIFGERAPVCPTCHQNFTVHHILIECPSFKSHRVDHFHSSSVTLQDLECRRNVLRSCSGFRLRSSSKSVLPTVIYICVYFLRVLLNIALRGSPSLGGYGCPNPEVPRDLYSLPVYPPLCLLLSADPFHPSTASEGALHERLLPLCLLLASHGQPKTPRVVRAWRPF